MYIVRGCVCVHVCVCRSEFHVFQEIANNTTQEISPHTTSVNMTDDNNDDGDIST